MVTNKVWILLDKVYENLKELSDLIGLVYDYDSEEYVCKNKDQVDDNWCDREMLASIDHAINDIEYFLGKR